MQLADQDSAIPSSGLEADWCALVALSAGSPGAVRRRPGGPASPLHALYEPLLAIGPTCAVAHLGQSLDGHIATAKGASHYVTGPEDILHNHRMRALFDAVVVGAGTVCFDDPRLTVRLCSGANPVRVVIDTERRLGQDYRVFQDGAAETLLLTAIDNAGSASHGAASVVGVPRRGTGLCPAAIREVLARRGLKRVFIEGGGVTVSRFVEAACLDRLQVTIAPLIIGSGRPGIALPQVDALSDGLRPRVRRFLLGDDVMFECIFDD